MSLKNKEIAEILNISPAAVSLALNNKPGVSHETRQKVLALRNGFYAETLMNEKPKQSLLFCVLKKHGQVLSGTPFFLSLSESLQQQCLIEGFDMQTLYYHPDINMDDFVKSIDTRKYRGILLLATEAEEEDIYAFQSLNIPLIAIDSWFESGKLDCVLVDNHEGILHAMQNVYEHGHRNIGFIQSRAHAKNFDERFQAYLNGLTLLNLPHNKEYIFTISPTVQGSFRDMAEILNRRPSLPTAFICCNDVVALGAMNAAKSLGYQVPQDLSFVGFDDMPTSQLSTPALTSLRVYIRRLARTAVIILVDRIRQETTSGEYIRCLIGTDLRLRDSVFDLNSNSSQN